MATPVLPQPIYAGQTGGGGGSSFLEQLLLTLAAQAPDSIQAHLARKDAQRKMEGEGLSAQASINALLAAAQADPSMAPIQAGIGAFQALGPEQQMLAAPGVLQQLTGLTEMFPNIAETRARTGVFGAQQTNIEADTNARRGAERRAEAIAPLERAGLVEANRKAEIENWISENTRDFAVRGAELDNLLQESLIARNNAEAARLLAEKERLSQEAADRAQEVAMRFEEYERSSIAAALETLTPYYEGNPAGLRRAAARFLGYGEELPALKDIRRDAQARAGAAAINLFADTEQELIDRTNSQRAELIRVGQAAGDFFSVEDAETLDRLLERVDGDPTAAMRTLRAQVDAGALVIDDLVPAAIYYGIVTHQPVGVPGPPPAGWGARLKRFLELLGSGAEERHEVLERRQGSAGPSPADILRDLGIDSPEMVEQMRQSAARAMRNFERPRP